jgi:formylglycine-generating enzyme required for sulfatase activity
LKQAGAELAAKAEALARAETGLAEWRPRAERAEKMQAQAEAQVKAKTDAQVQAQEKLAAAQTAAERAAAEWQAKVTALEKALAEWRARGEKAEAQLAEIAAKARAEAEAQAEAARRAAEEAAQRRGSASVPALGPRIGIELIKIPAGEFLYGENKQKVSLPAFAIAKTPVTVAQFEAFVQATGYRTTAEQQGSGYAYNGSNWVDTKGADWRHPRGPGSNATGNHPVTQVSWEDAQAFCKWAGLRLPTEQEWEKGARGTDGREYPWGAAAPTNKLCNFSMNVNDTTPVGRYSPAGDSPYGCADMAGNVWEWCEDYYDNSKDTRVLRGGSFAIVPRSVRCAYRNRLDPENRYANYGFRVVSPGL